MRSSVLLAAFGVFGLFVSSSFVLAADPPAAKSADTVAVISDADAATHAGQKATVEGKIVAVGTSKQGNTYLNFGAKHPNETFSGVILPENADAIKDAKNLEGKKVRLTGQIEMYNGKPRMVIRSRDQIEVVQ